MEIGSMLSFLQSILVGLANAWRWLTSPLDFGSLSYLVPSLLRTPLSILSIAGLTTILILHIIKLILGAIPIA